MQTAALAVIAGAAVFLCLMLVVRTSPPAAHKESRDGFAEND